MGMYGYVWGGQRDLEMHTVRVKCDANKSDHDTIGAQTNTNNNNKIWERGTQ